MNIRRKTDSQAPAWLRWLISAIRRELDLDGEKRRLDELAHILTTEQQRKKK